MGCLKYEYYKLGKKGVFLILSVVLLAANVLALYMTERTRGEFTLVFEQRENYEAFIGGDASVDVNEFYSQEQEAQEAYVASYPEFITGMTERVERMGKISIFSDKESYTYQNMLKTCEDYERFSEVVLQADNCYGIRAFARYQIGVLFMLVFLAVLTYYVIFFERDKNLILLIKGTREGHAATAFSKLLVMLSAAGIYTMLQEALAILTTGYLYGYGDLSRAIQSVPEFRNCTYMLSLGEGLVGIVLIRAVTAMLFVCIFFCVAMFIKNEMTAAAIAAGASGLLFLVGRLFSVNGSFDWLVCINPFYCWDMKSVLGQYHNLNIAGQPVHKDICIILVMALISGILMVSGILAYSKTCQTRSESRLEWIMQKVRQKTTALSSRTSLLYYEFYKMLIQQKKIILLILILILCIRESSTVFGTQYYATIQEVSYHYYLDRYQGRITEKVMEEIQDEEAYISSLYEELSSLGNNPTGDDYSRQFMIKTELEKKEPGFSRLQTQIEALKEKEGNLYDKYLVDELDYNELWNDTERDITLWLFGSVILIFFLGGIYTMDEKRKMTGLLRSTKSGRKSLDKSRGICASICTLIVFVCMELPLFLEYCYAGVFTTAGHRLSDMTSRSFSSTVTLGIFVIVVFLLKAAAYTLVCFMGLRVSKMLKSELPVLLACAGGTAIIAAVLYRLGMDIEMMMIYIL